ncbi:MAG: hypothetical protein QOF10_1370 [Kribbellaceae bacterium]|nr:hypothetical protein [Kribbellaceae bacterium]
MICSAASCSACRRPRRRGVRRPTDRGRQLTPKDLSEHVLEQLAEAGGAYPLIAGDLVVPDTDNPADACVLRQVAGEVAGAREHDWPNEGVAVDDRFGWLIQGTFQ